MEPVVSNTDLCAPTVQHSSIGKMGSQFEELLYNERSKTLCS